MAYNFSSPFRQRAQFVSLPDWGRLFGTWFCLSWLAWDSTSSYEGPFRQENKAYSQAILWWTLQQQVLVDMLTTSPLYGNETFSISGTAFFLLLRFLDTLSSPSSLSPSSSFFALDSVCTTDRAVMQSKTDERELLVPSRAPEVLPHPLRPQESWQHEGNCRLSGRFKYYMGGHWAINPQSQHRLAVSSIVLIQRLSGLTIVIQNIRYISSSTSKITSTTWGLSSDDVASFITSTSSATSPSFITSTLTVPVLLHGSV